MQTNPGTAAEQQPDANRVDLEQVIRGLGPDRLTVVDPYDVQATTAAIVESLSCDAGVGVVIARRECAIQAARRRVTYGTVTVDAEKCTLCKQCLRITGCPALGCSSADAEEQLGEPAESGPGSPGGRAIEIDQALCNACGICVSFCPTNALSHAPNSLQRSKEPT